MVRRPQAPPARRVVELSLSVKFGRNEFDAGPSNSKKASMISMKLNQQANRPSGLTILEVLVVVVTLCLFALVFLPLLARPRHRGSPVTACGSNLKQMALAEIVWANDHDATNKMTVAEIVWANDATNTFPAHRSTNYGGFRELLSPGSLPHFYRALSNELINPRLLTCPSDSRKPTEDFASLTSNQLSYFLNMDARSEAETSTAIHGDRHITFNPAARGQIVTLTTNLSLGWTRKAGHGSVGNISLADGSVMKATDRDLTELLLAPSRVSVQRLLFP